MSQPVSRRTVLAAGLLVPPAVLLGPSALAAAATGGTTAAAASDWTMGRRGPNRNAVATESVIGPTTVGSLRQTATIAEGFGLGELVTSGASGFAKVGSTRVQALRLASLKGTWRAKTARPNPDYSAPAVVGGVVYTATQGASTVFAFDAATGATRWSVEPGPPSDVVASVAVVGGLVYVAYRNGALVALAAATGRTVWQVPQVHDVTIGDLWSSPAVSLGTVYVAAELLAAYNAKTGVKLFSTALPVADDYSLLPPAAVDNTVVVPTFDGVTAFNAGTGKVLWHKEVGQALPVAFNGANVLVAAGGALTSLVASTGAVHWSVSIGDSTDGGGGVTFANGVVYVAASASFSAYSAGTGKRLWTGAPPAFGVATGIVVSGGVVYTSDSTGTLTAYRTS